MKLRTLTIGTILGAAGIAIYLWVVGPLSNHDEPIIIENGPISIKFRGVDSVERGYLIEKRYISRQPAEPLIRIRFWRGETEIFCDNKPCDLAKDKFSATVTLTSGKNLEFHWRKESGKKGALLMSSLDHYLSETIATDYSEFKPDPSLLVKSVTFWPAGEQAQKTIDLRQAGDTSTKVKVQFCANSDPKHCPD